ncbi:hypothetical protein M23134_08270 [Microscilla marina ATCC 23134]|uniref:Uncharacterized protein n=1 Tax=Microscilla marina ATCC 23134 TaxID=313606 RepID=A1ZQE6_MICM2|nr:hypothetical protein M23134_08270 [Microscilla marina ATCC 23134]
MKKHLRAEKIKLLFDKSVVLIRVDLNKAKLFILKKLPFVTTLLFR